MLTTGARKFCGQTPCVCAWKGCGTAGKRQFDHRKQRRVDELCGWKGCKEVTGDKFYCDVHGALDAAKNRRLRRRRREKAA